MRIGQLIRVLCAGAPLKFDGRRRARVVSWTATEIEMTGGPVHVVRCFDVSIWNDGDPSAGH